MDKFIFQIKKIMKKPVDNKIRLGIFVSVSIALLIVGIYFIGERQQLFNRTFGLSGIFKDISGLEVGNNVRFSGINVGVVNDIQQITDSTVRVDMMINLSTKKFIKKNAKVIIGTDGLMGNKILSIIPGNPGLPEIADKDYLETTVPVSMDDIMQKIKITSDNAALITGDLADIIGTIHDGKGTIGKLFMDSVFAQNLDKTIVNIKQGAGGFKKNMDAASHNFLLKGFFRKKKDTER
jgi:phospholipid/cholesterol/gamma-HCH transport system substrate-binding protein